MEGDHGLVGDGVGRGGVGVSGVGAGGEWGVVGPGHRNQGNVGEGLGVVGGRLEVGEGPPQSWSQVEGEGKL